MAATAVVVANMIGTGIFTSTGYLASEVGTAGWILAAWLLGGLVALAGALCYAELATAFPESGGEVVYLRELYGPLPAFLSGWVSVLAGFAAPTAAAALAVAAYLEPFAPALAPDAGVTLVAAGPLEVRLGAGQVLALAIIAVLATVHGLGLRPGARLQTILTSFKVVLLGVFLAAGFLLGRGDAANLTAPAAPTDGSLAGGFAVSLVLVMFAYSGFNAAAYLGGEVREPRRNLPLAMGLGTALVVILYLALNVLFLQARPAADYTGRANVGEVAAFALFGPEVGGLFGLLMSAALLSTVSAMVMAGPRVAWALARQGAFPAWAARVDPRTGVPVRAIVLQAAVAALLALTGTMYSLMILIGFTLTAFAALTVGGLFVLRRRGPVRGFAVPLYPLPPLLFCGVSLWMIAWSFLEQPRPTIAVTAALAVGIAAYHLRRKS